MSHRIYIVTETVSGTQHLVKAGSQSPQAVHYIARMQLAVVIARPLDVANLMAAGGSVLDATTSLE